MSRKKKNADKKSSKDRNNVTITSRLKYGFDVENQPARFSLQCLRTGFGRWAGPSPIQAGKKEHVAEAGGVAVVAVGLGGIGYLDGWGREGHDMVCVLKIWGDWLDV